jgi:hypothetical protein
LQQDDVVGGEGLLGDDVGQVAVAGDGDVVGLDRVAEVVADEVGEGVAVGVDGAVESFPGAKLLVDLVELVIDVEDGAEVVV